MRFEDKILLVKSRANTCGWAITNAPSWISLYKPDGTKHFHINTSTGVVTDQTGRRLVDGIDYVITTFEQEV